MENEFDAGLFNNELIKGNLRAAMSYLSRFPEQSELYARYTALFRDEKYLTYEADPELNEILLCYQQYYREVFYLEQDPEEAARRLWSRLAELIYSRERNLLERFLGRANTANPGDGHGLAAERIACGFEARQNRSRNGLAALPVETVQAVSMELFRDSSAEMERKYC